MLQYLKIKHFAIIEHAEMHFKTGMTTVTGETGAGKSILMQALSVALGLRIDSSLVNTKTTAEISAIFNIEKLAKAKQFLQDNALNDRSDCIVVLSTKTASVELLSMIHQSHSPNLSYLDNISLTFMANTIIMIYWIPASN